MHGFAITYFHNLKITGHVLDTYIEICYIVLICVCTSPTQTQNKQTYVFERLEAKIIEGLKNIEEKFSRIEESN
jgi:hypothetical protein